MVIVSLGIYVEEDLISDKKKQEKQVWNTRG